MQTAHAIEANCSPDTAFALCLDVENWPGVFPPCLSAKVLEETDSEQLIELTAKANEEVFNWQSRRTLDRDARRIGFAQARTSPLVKHMKGAWTIEVLPHGSRITLSHEFEVKDDVAGLVPGVHTPAEAEAFMIKTIEDNSSRELAAIRKVLEREHWRHEFSEAMVIPHDETAIYQLLRGAHNWPWLLPHCKAVDMLYDDPDNQEFKMTVMVGEQEESLRTIRRLQPGKIEYFQPEPPPPLKEHRGRWTLRDTPAGVEVTSWHEVVLSAGHWTHTDVASAKQTVEAAINRASLGTMKAIFNKLGGNAHAGA